MENGFLDTIASVIPTVGKVVGNLLVNTFKDGENEEGGYVGFFGCSGRDDGLDKAVFVKENDKIMLCNTSPVTKDYIVYSTPTQYNVEADACRIPGLGRIDVTQSFADAVSGGDERIFLNSIQEKKTTDGSGILTVYGCNNHVELDKLWKTDGTELGDPGRTKIKLGSWLQMETGDTQFLIISCAAIAATTYIVRRIRRVVVNEGNVNIDLTDPPQREIEPGVIEVALGQNLPERGVAAIDMQAELEELPQPEASIVQNERVMMMDEAYLQTLLAKKKASNRK